MKYEEIPSIEESKAIKLAVDENANYDERVRAVYALAIYHYPPMVEQVLTMLCRNCSGDFVMVVLAALNEMIVRRTYLVLDNRNLDQSARVIAIKNNPDNKQIIWEAYNEILMSNRRSYEICASQNNKGEK